MATTRKKVLLALCVAAVSTSVLPAAAADNQGVLQQADVELSNNDARSAYNRLLPLEDQMAGDPTYDALFGEAALRVGESTRALMAFERCVTMVPRNGNCRLGLARAHMALKEKQTAYQEFQIIKESSPPPKVAEAVDQYLGQLAGNKQASPRHWRGYINLALGYDDNTNVAPTSSSIPGAWGGVGTFTSATDSSTFGQAGLGLTFSHPVSDRWDALAGLTAQTTDNTQVADNSAFDKVAQWGGYVGATGRYGKQRLGLMAQGQNYRLSDENYRNMASLTGQYGYVLNAQTQVNAFLQYARLDYQYGPGDDLQNVNSVTTGVSMAKSLASNKVVTFGGIYLGDDSKVESAANDNIESRYAGLRGGVTWFFREGWQAGTNLLVERRQYDGKGTGSPPFVLFPNRQRKDTLANLTLNLGWQITKKFSLNSQYSLTQNRSSIPVREYDRQIVSVGVRYDFL